MKLPRLFALAVLVSPALALAGVATPGQCTDGFEDCKEDCVMEFGTSVTTREKLTKCMGSCTRTHASCQERYFDVTSNSLDPDALSRKRPRDSATEEDLDAPPRYRAEPERTPYRDEDRQHEPTGRSREEPVRRSATRMSDPEEDEPPLKNAKKAPPPDDTLDPMLRPEPPRSQENDPDAEAPPVRRSATRMSEPEEREPMADDPPVRRSAQPVRRSATRMYDPEDIPPPGKTLPAKEPLAAEPPVRRDDPDADLPSPSPRRAADWVPGDPTPAEPQAAAPPKKKEPEKAPPPKDKNKEADKDKPAGKKKRALDEWDPDAF